MPHTLRWLHLSDFHVGKDDYGQVKLFQTILNNIKVHTAQSPLDYVFITGDIAQSGAAEQYDLFQSEFLEKLSAQIEPDGRILIVPGNHDLDRTKAKFVTRDAIQKSLNFFDASQTGREERQAILPRFQHYHQKILFPARWLDTAEGCFVERNTIRGMDVGILGINTAWLVEGDDKEALNPGKHLIEAGLEKIQDAQVRIVLGHHPIHWFSESLQNPIHALLGQANVLYLHGHLHQTRSSLQDGAGNPYLALQTGASFQAREHEIWRNRILWAELNPDKQVLTMTPLCWNVDNQEWAMDGSAFPMRYHQKGHWVLPLPGQPTISPSEREDKSTTPTPTTAAASVKTHLAKLPVVSQDCFGRETVFEQLDQTLADSTTNLFILVAWGGVGKTTLVGHWLHQLQHTGYQNLQRVFGWSFYSQGSAEDRQASSDMFIQSALQWFGVDAESGSLWDKGVRLAACIRREPTLLILDGLEPLQYPPGEMQGRLKDQGLQALLRELSYATAGWGLCVVTTRLAVADVAQNTGGSVREEHLAALSTKAGVMLLKQASIVGSDSELAETVQAYDTARGS